MVGQNPLTPFTSPKLETPASSLTRWQNRLRRIFHSRRGGDGQEFRLDGRARVL